MVNDNKRPASPELLVADKTLDAAEKEKLLTQWKLDLELELNATEENMPATDAKGVDASISELLRRVNNCLLNVEKAA
ncbi:MAG: hypothetical protein ABI439_11330 [Rhodospirillales bacterium]